MRRAVAVASGSSFKSGIYELLINLSQLNLKEMMPKRSSEDVSRQVSMNFDSESP